MELEDLAQRHGALVRHICRGYRLSDQDAEDVSQDVWLLVLEHREVLSSGAEAGWIATTTRQLCLRLLRAEQRLLPSGLSDEELLAALTRLRWEREPVDELIDRERMLALAEAVACLPAHQQELLRLLTSDPPLPYAEIGRRFGAPIGSIGPTRTRMLNKLREALSEI